MEGLSLWFISRKLLAQASCQAHHAGRSIAGAQENIEEMQLMLVRKGGGEALFELSLGAYPRAPSTPNQIAHLVILPFIYIVKGTVQDLPFG